MKKPKRPFPILVCPAVSQDVNQLTNSSKAKMSFAYCYVMAKLCERFN